MKTKAKEQKPKMMERRALELFALNIEDQS
jgi:hypothetical protein